MTCYGETSIRNGTGDEFHLKGAEKSCDETLINVERQFAV